MTTPPEPPGPMDPQQPPPPYEPPPPSAQQPYQEPYQQPYQPYGYQAPGGQGYPAYGQPAWSPEPVRTTNGMAVAALVTSIAGLVMCCGAPSVIGAILGHVARGQIRRGQGTGDGLALAGIIVGWLAFGLFLLVVAVYIGLFAVAFSASP